MSKHQTSNQLGVLALALNDAQLKAAQEASGLGQSACATIVTLGVHSNLTIREMASIAGITHSVMVRTVADMVRRGLLARQTGDDRRNVALRLTEPGVLLRGKILKARGAVLDRALKKLTPTQSRNLEKVLGPLLTGLTTGREQADHICRLCDIGACGADCPVELAACRIESLPK